MKKLDALFPKNVGKLSFRARYSKDQLKKYEADLLYVVMEMNNGKCRPLLKDLQAYFLDAYGISVADGTLRKHLRTLEIGQTLWPEK